jgi:hypothetical protein
MIAVHIYERCHNNPEIAAFRISAERGACVESEIGASRPRDEYAPPRSSTLCLLQARLNVLYMVLQRYTIYSLSRELCAQIQYIWAFCYRSGYLLTPY